MSFKFVIPTFLIAGHAANLMFEGKRRRASNPPVIYGKEVGNMPHFRLPTFDGYCRFCYACVGSELLKLKLNILNCLAGLSVLRGDQFITFAERGRVPKSKRSKRGCMNLVL